MNYKEPTTEFELLARNPNKYQWNYGFTQEIQILESNPRNQARNNTKLHAEKVKLEALKYMQI